MKSFTSTKNILLATIIILLAALSRLLPHPDNVTPIGAMALLGGAYLNRKALAFIVPVLALFISDLLINNTIMRGFFPDQSGIVFFSEYMIWSYLGFIAMVVVGILFLNRLNPSRLIGTSLLASSLFFLLSNFGSWMTSPIYARSWEGLISCYIAALPFFRSSIFGDLIFVFILFGAYHTIIKYAFSRLQTSKVI